MNTMDGLRVGGWTSRTLQLLTDLQFELDVDLYVSGPELPE